MKQDVSNCFIIQTAVRNPRTSDRAMPDLNSTEKSIQKVLEQAEAAKG